MMTYSEAVTLLGSKLSKKVDRNTLLMRHEGGSMAIVFHGTAVVLMHPDGSYELRTGGYETSTTKDRINKFSPARVYAVKRELRVGDVAFREGMRVDSLGRVIG